MAFNCTGCGECCKQIGKTLVAQHTLIPWMRAVVREFPYKAKENGHCEMLVDDKCSVYEDRPLLCNIDKMADDTTMPLSKFEWYKMNYEGCGILQSKVLEVRIA